MEAPAVSTQPTERTRPTRSAVEPEGVAGKRPKGLPQPPSDGQKFSYVKRHMWLLNTFTLCSFGCVAFSTVRFSLVSDDLWAFLVVLALTGLGLAVAMQANLFSRDFDDAEHRRLVDGWRPAAGRYPSVDVFLPICGEDRRVLINTWGHVLALDYPDVTVYCLDDSPDDRIRPIAEEFGFHYLRRDNRGWFKKAGNLKFGYENSTGDFVLILDADFAPRPDFLRNTIPYFQAEPDLGIVQTPQFFDTSSGQNWLERGACAVQELFYRVVQVSRESRNASICVGTCAVYRRAALDSNGGTTLIEHSEDVHTGFDLRRHGWRLRYVPVNLAAGLCPDDISGFFRQQYRWCMGSMSLCTSRKFWATKMPLRTRLCYTSGFLYYMLTALLVFTAPLMPLTLTLFFPSHIHLVNYVLLMPALLWVYVVMPLWHRCRFRLEVLSVKLTYGWAHAFAIVDLFRGKPMGWTPTGAKVRDNRVVWFRVLSALWGGGTAALLLGGCLWQIADRGYSATQFVPMLIFTGIYLRTNSRIILYGASLRWPAWLKSIAATTEETVIDEAKQIIRGVERTLGGEEAGLAVVDAGVHT
jgi:cellulose synthase (UDP-forming)